VKLEKQTEKELPAAWLRKPATHRVVAACADPLIDQIRKLERRVRELETAPPRAAYARIWLRGCAYPAGVFVSHKSDNELWFAQYETALLEPRRACADKGS
jgi:hypothetical protein